MKRGKHITFDTTLLVGDAQGEEREIKVTVEADYTPGFPGTWYKKNGDPGDPPEPSECKITSVVSGGQEMAFDLLSESNQDQLDEEAIEKAEEEPEPD